VPPAKPGRVVNFMLACGQVALEVDESLAGRAGQSVAQALGFGQQKRRR
jgi:hypothetical protein